MKTILAILLVISSGAVAQEKAANTNANQGITTEVSNPAVTGSGKTNYVPLWLSSAKLGNSVIYQTSGKVGIGTTTPTATLDVNGSVNAVQGFNLQGQPFLFGSATNSNVFLGFAGNATMTGSSNTALGSAALSSNLTGYSNTAIGYRTLVFDTSSWNSAFGWGALYSDTSGFQNTATGAGALLYNTSGLNNVAVGFQAAYYNATGSNNTAIGFQAGPDQNSTNLTNSTAIGSNAVVSESNALVLGGTGQYAVKVGIGTATPANVFTIAQGAGAAIADGWSVYSSRRFKTNIETLQDALAKVMQLHGVSYDAKDSGKHEIGVIAEEVGAVVPEVVMWEKNGTDAQAVDYGRLTALLIEATKEQQALIHQQQEQIRAQQAQIARLTLKVKTIQASLARNGRTGSEVRTAKAEVPAVHE